MRFAKAALVAAASTAKAIFHYRRRRLSARISTARKSTTTTKRITADAHHVETNIYNEDAWSNDSLVVLSSVENEFDTDWVEKREKEEVQTYVMATNAEWNAGKEIEAYSYFRRIGRPAFHMVQETANLMDSCHANAFFRRTISYDEPTRVNAINLYIQHLYKYKNQMYTTARAQCNTLRRSCPLKRKYFPQGQIRLEF